MLVKVGIRIEQSLPAILERDHTADQLWLARSNIQTFALPSVTSPPEIPCNHNSSRKSFKFVPETGLLSILKPEFPLIVAPCIGTQLFPNVVPRFQSWPAVQLEFPSSYAPISGALPLFVY